MLGNPYVIDRPVTEEDPFATRYPVLARVGQWLRQGKQIVFIHGAPRAGKTSFLRQLASDLASDFAVLQVNYSWQAGLDADSTLRELQRAVDEGLGAVQA